MIHALYSAAPDLLSDKYSGTIPILPICSDHLICNIITLHRKVLGLPILRDRSLK